MQEETVLRRIAMLIDGDNAQPKLLEAVLAEAGKYGVVTIRRIYGDWTTTTMKQWKETLNIHAVQPIQQFRYTTGKNATDSAMIIDAMDILFEGRVSGFCLVSSDSDYTRLATRIREKGVFVIGVGRKDTPRAFVNACEVFAYTENLQPQPKEERKTKSVGRHTKAIVATDGSLPLLTNAFEMAVEEDGWATLAVLGNKLRQLDPGFDSRTYGHKQLSTLIKHVDVFEVREEKSRGGPTTIYVKLND